MMFTILMCLVRCRSRSGGQALKPHFKKKKKKAESSELSVSVQRRWCCRMDIHFLIWHVNMLLLMAVKSPCCHPPADRSTAGMITLLNTPELFSIALARRKRALSMVMHGFFVCVTQITIILPSSIYYSG